MKDKKLQKKEGSKKVSDERPTPPRVAHRLKGVVKNVGIKKKKK